MHKCNKLKWITQIDHSNRLKLNRLTHLKLIKNKPLHKPQLTRTETQMDKPNGLKLK